jgi:hypothetical protein
MADLKMFLLYWLIPIDLLCDETARFDVILAMPLIITARVISLPYFIRQYQKIKRGAK